MPLEEADYGMTDMAMNPNPRHAGDDRLWVQFHVLPMVDDAKSAEEGRPIYRDVEHVRILTPGNKDSIVDRPVTEMDVARFRKQYDTWKTQEKEIVEGTLLTSVARDPLLRLTPSQIEELRYFNIRTVEQLANVADVHAQKFMGIGMLKKNAVAYLTASKEKAATTRLEAELESRDNKIASLEQALAGLQEQLKAVQESSAPKRGPGRPPKVA